MKNPKFLQLIFRNIATKDEVSFSAFIESFKDEYKSNWNSKEVYGRMDPISTFKGTVRVISLTWRVPSNSLEEAEQNHNDARKLVKMLYPMYEGTALSASPLMKVYLANFICDDTIVGKEGDGTADSGLICAVDGFAYNPSMDEGFYVVDENKIYAQKIEFSCNLTVHHQGPLGLHRQPIIQEAKKKLSYEIQEPELEDIQVEEITEKELFERELKAAAIVDNYAPKEFIK